MQPIKRIEEFDKGAMTEFTVGLSLAGVFGSLAVYCLCINAPLASIAFMFVAAQGFRYLGRTYSVSTCGTILSVLSLFLGLMYTVIFTK